MCLFLNEPPSPGERSAPAGSRFRSWSNRWQGGRKGGDWPRIIQAYPADPRGNQLPVTWAAWARAGYLSKPGPAGKEEGRTDAGEGKKKKFRIVSSGFLILVAKESFGQSAPWSAAKRLCPASLRLDSNFLLRSVGSGVANISHRWLLALASWHLRLLQALLMEPRSLQQNQFWHVLI